MDKDGPSMEAEEVVEAKKQVKTTGNTWQACVTTKAGTNFDLGKVC